MAFQTKRFLRNKIMHLEYRIKDLEERLCPCSSHKFKHISSRVVPDGFYDLQVIRRYKCTVCGKEMEDYD